MKNILTYISVGVLTASSALCQIIAQPQTATASETSQGSLGKRYAEVNFSVSDMRYLSANIYNAGVGVNVPVTSYLDVGGGYSYNWYKSDYDYFSQKLTTQSLSTGLVLYKRIAGGLKPFIAGNLGYSWFTDKLDDPYFSTHENYKDDFGTWAVAVGVEIPFRWVAFTPTITYNGNFKEGWANAENWSYGLKASSWITTKVGVYVDAAYSEPKGNNHYNLHTWTYTAGLRIKF